MIDQTPIHVLHLFRPERAALLELLGSLGEAEWELSTACDGWTVKDVALHILAGDVGIVARKRDGFHVPLPEAGSFVEALNLHNALWLDSTRRFSTPLLTDLLNYVGDQAFSTFESLDLTAVGQSVYWAGPDPAPVWLDVAREYTERWHHQQHIRDAVGRPGLMDPEFASPIFETFAWALPWSFRDIAAEPGTTVELRVSGPAGGRWRIVRGASGWSAASGSGRADASVELAPDGAWKMYTGGLAPVSAEAGATIDGDRELARAIFTARAIIV